jgi:hypothetical protein
LCGLDQSFWLEQPGHAPLPGRVNALLARCVVAVGDPPRPLPDTPAWVCSLTIGDREALLLHLELISLGSRITSTLVCPQCKEKLNLDLAVDDLLLPPYLDSQRAYLVRLDGYEVTFRLPTVGDQEAITNLAQTDLDAAVAALAERCLLSVTYLGQPAQLPAALQSSLGSRISELDPQAELNLQMTCPACGITFSSLLDMAQFLGTEMTNRSRSLDREIHTLALAYHWSEAEILSLPLRRRQTYLRLLDELGVLWLPGGRSG